MRPSSTAAAVVAIAVLILCAAAFLRFVHLGADSPRSLSPSTAELLDGFWYLGEAADEARGQPVYAPEQYRKPIYTALGRTCFAAFGAGVKQSQAIAAAGGLLLVAVVMAGGARAFGAPVGLVAGAFAACSFVLVGYGRSPVVYGWLAAGMATSFWLFVEGLRAEARRARLIAFAGAWAVLLGFALGLKETALVQLGPALLAGHVVAARRPGRAAALAVAAAVALLAVLAGAMLAVPSAYEKLAGKVLSYVGTGPVTAVDLIERFFNFAPRSTLFFLMPVLSVVAWAGVVLVRTADEKRERAAVAALGAWLAATILTGFPILGVKEEGLTPPLRYFMPAAVPIVLLAARTLCRLARPAGIDGWTLPRAAVLPWALLLGYTVAYGVCAGVGVPAGFETLLGAGAAFAVVATLVLGGRRISLRLPKAAALVLGLAALAPDAVELGRWLGAPRYTLLGANELLARALPPGAAVVGNGSYGLTNEAPHVVRRYIDSLDLNRYEVRRQLAVDGFTHLAIGWPGLGPDDPYFRTKEVLVPVHAFAIREVQIFLLRFAWAEPLGYRPTDVERELERRFAEVLR